jgi:hypothetical protein
MSKGKRLDLDKKLKESSGVSRLRLIIGGISFVVVATFVLIHLGFIEDTAVNRNYQPQPFLTRTELWLYNIGIGAFGGAILGYPKLIPGLVSGIVAASAITGSTLLYLSWRENIYMAEIIIPLITGFVGVVFYGMLAPEDSEEPA